MAWLRLFTAILSSQEFPVALNFTHIDWASAKEGKHLSCSMCLCQLSPSSGCWQGLSLSRVFLSCNMRPCTSDGVLSRRVRSLCARVTGVATCRGGCHVPKTSNRALVSLSDASCQTSSSSPRTLWTRECQITLIQTVTAPMPRLCSHVKHCIDLLAQALKVPADAELATVCFETREQRLVWRDLLSEPVSQHEMKALHSLFDITFPRVRGSGLFGRVLKKFQVCRSILQVTSDVFGKIPLN